MHVLEVGRVERSLSFQARREALHLMAPQYREASLSKKRTLLKSFIATTGYVRKPATDRTLTGTAPVFQLLAALHEAVGEATG